MFHSIFLVIVLCADPWRTAIVGQLSHLSPGSLSAGRSSGWLCPLQKPQPTNEWRGHSCDHRRSKVRNVKVSFARSVRPLQSVWMLLPRELGVNEGHDLWPAVSRKWDHRRILLLWTDTWTRCYFSCSGRLWSRSVRPREIMGSPAVSINETSFNCLLHRLCRHILAVWSSTEAILLKGSEFSYSRYLGAVWKQERIQTENARTLGGKKIVCLTLVVLWVKSGFYSPSQMVFRRQSRVGQANVHIWGKLILKLLSQYLYSNSDNAGMEEPNTYFVWALFNMSRTK